jgi:peptidoglycan/xylan/chitin deacetylase (PgdA/CDA1 family)
MYWRGLLVLGGAIVVLAACRGGEGDPPPQAAVITSGPADRSSVALTFDAVGDAGVTDAILQLLSAHGVRATFAVAGLWAEKHPALLNAIASDGHQIINLTYNYASLTSQTSEQRALELSRTETTVFRMSSRSTRPYFRPPYGEINDPVLRDASEAGYAFAVLSTIDARDQALELREAVAPRVIADAPNGAIIALSLGRSTAEALPAMLDGLASLGFAFETVAEIIE